MSRGRVAQAVSLYFVIEKKIQETAQTPGPPDAYVLQRVRAMCMPRADVILGVLEVGSSGEHPETEMFSHFQLFPMWRA